jgi:hypothetical protein
MNAIEKICPECRVEYRATAEMCSDCNVALVFESELADDALSELPPADQMVPIRIAGLMWSRAFSDALSEAGIRHRIDEPPRTGARAEKLRKRSHDEAVAIYVLQQDVDRAQEVDAAFVRTQIPDIPHPNQTEGAGDESSCPACGDPLRDESSECPGCGLFLGDPA